MTKLRTIDFDLYRNVISKGYCIGCGACAVITDSPFSMEMSKSRIFQAAITKDESNDRMNVATAAVCPFLSETNEDVIAEEQFAGQATFDDKIGYFTDTFCGYVSDEGERLSSGSGGLTIWLAKELLRRQWVDGVIHVTTTGRSDKLFEYCVQQDVEALDRARKSRYYPVEFSAAVELIRAMPGQRFAFVGVPCFVKAMQLLRRADPIIGERVQFTIAIFCGHLKSEAFGEFLGWRAGVSPQELQDIDFRWKIPNRPANEYGIRILKKARDVPQGVEVIRPVAQMFGADWGLGYFKPKACDYCDDIAGETADVSFGDAWLPEAVEDYRGTNVVVIRNREIRILFEEARSAGTITVSSATPAEVAQSQAANYRHRRVGLSHRLNLQHKRGEWTPPKRIRAGQFKISTRYKLIFRLRSKLSEKSHKAYSRARAGGSLVYFDLAMAPYVAIYYVLYLFDSRRLRKLWRRFLPRIRR